MKMRKIISLLGALTMAASAFSTAAFAANTTKLTLNTTVTSVDNATFNDYYGEDIPEGMAAYFVDFTVSGIEDELSYTKTGGTNAKPKYTGIALDNMEIILTTEDSDGFATIDQDYSYLVEKATNTSVTVGEGFADNMWSTNYAGNYVYPATKDTSGVEDGATPGYLTMCFVMDAAAEVNFVVSDATLSFKEYTDGTMKGQSDFTLAADTLVVNGDIKLAPAAIEVEDVVVNSADKYDNGYVWNVTVNKNVEAFGVKFYSGNDSIEKSVKNVEDIPKLDGGVGFELNVGLKTTNEITQADFTADDYTATWEVK